MGCCSFLLSPLGNEGVLKVKEKKEGGHSEARKGTKSERVVLGERPGDHLLSKKENSVPNGNDA